jgi:YfiR/HmsC-like
MSKSIEKTCNYFRPFKSGWGKTCPSKFGLGFVFHGRGARKHKTAFILFCFVLLSMGLQAQISKADLEAAYIERFTRFIEWPDSINESFKDRPFVIGLVGKVSFKNELTEIYKKQKIKGAGVEIKLLPVLDTTLIFDMLIVGNLKNPELNALLGFVRQKPILTITAHEGFFDSDILIKLYFEQGRLKFDLDEGAFQQSGLKVSYLLLQYANKAKQNGGAL